MPEIGPSGSMSGEWKRDLRAPAPFLDSTPDSRAKVEDFDASLLEELRNNPELRKRILEQRDPVAKR